MGAHQRCDSTLARDISDDHPLFDIRGRTALVTGSSRGIGRALAQGLLEAGCTVVLHGTHPDDVATAAGHSSARRPSAAAVPCTT